MGWFLLGLGIGGTPGYMVCALMVIGTAWDVETDDCEG